MRQILLKHTGLSTQDLKTHREQLREARRLTRGIEMLRLLVESDREMDVVELGRRSGLTSDAVRLELGPKESLRRIRPNTWTVGVDDSAILDEIARVGRLPGGSPLSTTFYDSKKRTDLPGSVRVIQRFDTWSEACRRAGVESLAAVRSSYERRWTTDDLLDWVRGYLEEAGHAATYAGLTVWLKNRSGDGAPSSQTIRNTIGTWTDIVDLATMDRLAPILGAPNPMAE